MRQADYILKAGSKFNMIIPKPTGGCNKQCPKIPPTSISI